tara:strand:+ start:271 stop:813 length:543 start_codon:yes stop_codon:yes gene_type:complete
MARLLLLVSLLCSEGAQAAVSGARESHGEAARSALCCCARQQHARRQRRRAAEAASHLPPESSSGDHLITAISGDGSLSVKAAITTHLVAEAQRLQGLGALGSAALGRALTCSLLIAEGMKGDESFQVKFDGDGPLRGVLALANGRLEPRGYVGNPKVELLLNPKGERSAFSSFFWGGGI